MIAVITTLPFILASAPAGEGTAWTLRRVMSETLSKSPEVAADARWVRENPSIEVAWRDGSYRVYLLDDELKVRPVEGASGSIKVAKGGYPDVVLTPAGDTHDIIEISESNLRPLDGVDLP